MSKISSRTIIIIIIAAAVLLVGGWVVVYAFAPQFIDCYPAADNHIPSSSPKITVRWDYAWGAKLKKATVKLDGTDITGLISLEPRGFSYIPSSKLREGKHTVETNLKYSYIFKRNVELKWKFTTDTIPPDISFIGEVDGIIGTPKSKISLSGQTEPYTSLKGSFNNGGISLPEVKKKGQFKVSLNLLKKKNELKLTAQDLAGNKHTKVLTVIKDDKPPAIISLLPPEAQVHHTKDPKIVVKFSEPDTAIRSIKLKVDGNPVKTSYDSGSQILTFIPKYGIDGKHTASIQATDAAGNNTDKKWEFIVDSGNIIVRLSQRKLYYYKGKSLKAVYSIAVGNTEFPTPKGNWKIVRKRKNPIWRNPGEDWSSDMPDQIPAGPNNPLGQRALDLNAAGIRFHGTPNTGSVGRAVSHGCMRMYPGQIATLYEMVTIGTPVKITD